MSEVYEVGGHAADKCAAAIKDACSLFDEASAHELIATRAQFRIFGMVAGARAVQKLGHAAASDLSDTDRKAIYAEVLDDFVISFLELNPDHRNPRETLKQRRTGGVIDFAYGAINATFSAAFSLYAAHPGDPLRCAEVFLSVDRTQGDLEANVRDAGILASYALQHGATIETLCAGVTHESDGRGSSIVGTALHLVKEEIDRLRGEVAPPGPAPDGLIGASLSKLQLRRLIDSAMDAILGERRRQVVAERFDAAHDDAHTGDQLLRAALCYRAEGSKTPMTRDKNGLPMAWPWDDDRWKPKSRFLNLVRAGALLVAEDERYRRKGLVKGSPAARRTLALVVVDLIEHAMDGLVPADGVVVAGAVASALASDDAAQTVPSMPQAAPAASAPSAAAPLDAADPKELQNDGDPIAAAGGVWPYCETCGCRHATTDHCPVPDAAARRATQLLAPARSARPDGEVPS